MLLNYVLRSQKRLSMKFRSLALVLTAAAVFPAAAHALPDYVVVELFGAKPATAAVVVEGPLVITEGVKRVFLAGSHYEIRVAARGVEMRSIDATSVRQQRKTYGRSVFSARSITLGSSTPTIAVILKDSRRTYTGTIKFQPNSDGYLLIRNKTPLRDYVKSVVGSETNPDFKEEALKAQAVLTQTLLARYKQGDALSDTTEKQAYLGTAYVRPLVQRAVDSVLGRILTYKNLPATIYYHSTCAGGTSAGQRYFELKPKLYPYLASTNCRFCVGSPFLQVKDSVIPWAQFSHAFGEHLPLILQRDEHKRPLRIQLGNRRTGGFTLWSEIGTKLGWDKVPGTRFEIKQTPDRRVHLISSGAGHGVGMCQWGANGQAKLGKTYAEILGYYFPGTTIQKLK